MWLCVCLIAFDCLWLVWRVYDNIQHKEKGGKLQYRIYEQLDRIANGMDIDQRHKKYLIKKLKKVKYLMVFHETLLKYQKKDEAHIGRYLMAIRPVFTFLTFEFKNKKTMKKAYLAYVISKHKIFNGMVVDSIIDVLISYMYDDSIYCRENVMRVLYSFGDTRSIINGIKVLEQQNVYYHTKLLTDGLLTFQGNHSDLCQALWENFNSFTVLTRISIINYFRMKTGEMRQELYMLLYDDKTDVEIKYAVIRYFGKYESQTAKDLLLEFLDITQKDKWEFSALAALALGAYPDKEVVYALKKALSSSNWYVRLNSAKSLLSMNIDYDVIDQIMNGNDGFAREIFQYRMQYNHFITQRQTLVEGEAK
jgi:hypothetical protein